MKVDDLIMRALSEGRISVDAESGTVNWSDGRRVIPEMNPKGYLRFRIAVDGRKCHFRVHRVVYLATHGYIPEGCHIDHINGNKQDNRACNLRPLTDRENRREAARLRRENMERPQPLLFLS